MKKSELKHIIKEEVTKVFNEIKVEKPMTGYWDEAISKLIDLYSSGNDNEYDPGYEHEFNIEVELDADDDLIPFYNFLKKQPKKTYRGHFNTIPVSVTANTEWEDEDLGDLIVRFTEPSEWVY